MDIRLNLSSKESFSGLELALVELGKIKRTGATFGLLSIPEEMRGLILALGSGADRYLDGVAVGLITGSSETKGVHLGAVGNVNLIVSGLRCAGVGNVLHCEPSLSDRPEDLRFSGVDLAGLLNFYGPDSNVNGVSVAGVGNLYCPDSNVNGVSVAGVYNHIYKLRGVSLALINTAEELRGVQVGAVNVCEKDAIGVQVGLVNYRKGAPWYTRFLPGVAVRTNKKRKKMNK